MTDPSSFILRPGDGDVLKFGPPISGELIINVDARRSGSSFAMGTQTLQPGGVLPTIRHLGCDQVLFVHKGQGRVSLEGRSLMVVPGTMIYVPRQTWHSLRNTGTGLLQITWTAAPPGIEDFFRELAQLKDSSDAAALYALAQRHGVEFRSETESAAAPEGDQHKRHRGRRGGRGRRAPTSPTSPPQGQAPTAPVPVAPAVRPPQAAATPVNQQQPSRRRRRHRGGRGRSGASAQPSPAIQSKTAAAPAAHAPAPKQPPAAKPQRAGQRPGRGRPHRSRVKEVYMDGRWVQVSGEGPVIAPGREHTRDKKPADRDEDTPPGPLTVPL